MSDPNQRDFQWQKLSAPPAACHFKKIDCATMLQPINNQLKRSKDNQSLGVQSHCQMIGESTSQQGL